MIQLAVLLGALGPWQILIVLAIIILIVVLIVRQRKSNQEKKELDKIINEPSAPAQQPNQHAAESGMSDDKISQLQKIADLKEKGVLSEAEFQAEKQKIMGS